MSNNSERTRLAVLGSTGTIGCQTLDVVRRNPELYSVEVLCAGQNVDRVCEQVAEFSPALVVMADEGGAAAVRERCSRLRGASGPMTAVEVQSGADALEECVQRDQVDVVVAGLTGFQALRPVLAALRAAKGVALANKECLVAGGELVNEALRHGGALCPVDSEHSSIFQCLQGRGAGDAVREVVLTASGGPFLRTDLAELAQISPEQAVRHPRWRMGAKISVDSSTLMNKGLEVIEAAALFTMPAEQIGVVIHPESIVHGIVEYEDGAQIACLFSPDMRQPISYALGYLRSGGSNRVDRNGVPRLRLAEVGSLTFLPVDAARYPALGLCYEALRAGGTMTTVLNAANEVAVEGFLRSQLGFLEIVSTVERVLERHVQVGFVKNPTLDEIIEADRWARTAGKEWVAA